MTTTTQYVQVADRPEAPISVAELRALQLLDAELQRDDCVGFSATVQLVEGDQTAEGLVQLRSRISSAFRVGPGHVEIVPNPRNNSEAWLTVVRPGPEGEHPLEKMVLWRRPTINPQTGVFIHGRATNGSKVHLRAYDRVQGTKLFWVNGSTNGGKSTVVDRILLELCSTGMFFPIIIDMKGGGSLGDWRDRVPYFVAGDPSDIESGVQALSMLRGFMRMTSFRAKWLGTLKNPDGSAAKVLPLSTLCPAPILVLEEVPDLWPLCGLESVEIVEYLARNVRALMEILLLASQDTAIGQPGRGAMGGSNVLRRQLRDNGNVVILKNSKEAGGQAGEGSAIDLDPSLIPAIPGVNYAKTTLDEPPQMNRGMFVENVFHGIKQFVTIPDMGASHMDPLAIESLRAFEQGRDEYLLEYAEARRGGGSAKPNAKPAARSRADEVLDFLVTWLLDQDTPLAELRRADRDVAQRAEMVDVVITEFPGFSTDALDRVVKKAVDPEDGSVPRLRKAGHGKYALPANRPVQETAA